MGGEKQYVESEMCEQKHGEVLRRLDDNKEILKEIKDIVNPAVVTNTQSIKVLQDQKKSGVDTTFKVITIILAIGMLILAIVALKG